MCSVVERLTLKHKVHCHSSDELHNDVDRIQWRTLLRSFGYVKTLRVKDWVVEELSRCLQLEDGELPLELLPELQELTYFGSCDTDDARQNAGRPVRISSKHDLLLPSTTELFTYFLSGFPPHPYTHSSLPQPFSRGLTTPNTPQVYVPHGTL